MSKLREIQLVQLQILTEFDRICKKNDINYQLFAGTLLGAVRHKGFIPWDDDVDVCMLRSEYDRFLEIAQQELDPDYFVQNTYTDPEYYNIFTRIRKNGTFHTFMMYNNWGEGFYVYARPLGFPYEPHRPRYPLPCTIELHVLCAPSISTGRSGVLYRADAPASWCGNSPHHRCRVCAYLYRL